MRIASVLLLAGVCVVARPAGAAPVTDPRQLSLEQRALVERLANEGATLFAQGDFASALLRFEEAEKTIRIPTITLERGRSLERLGRWVDASSAYEQAASHELAAAAPLQHKIAQQEAQKALAEIAPRIPKLTVKVKDGRKAEVLVDGRLVGAVSPDPILIDPGSHVVEVKGARGESARKEVQMAVGATTAIELSLLTLEEQELLRRGASEDGPSVFAISAYAGFALSGACLVVGIGTGVPALSLKSDLEERCADGRCEEEAWPDVDEYDALRWTSGVMLIGGALIGGGAVAALLLDPEAQPKKTASVSPLLGPGFVGLRGVFP